MTSHTSFRRSVSVLVGAMLIAACDLRVVNPGPIADEDLDHPMMMPALVAGMSGDLSNAVSRVLTMSAIASDELAHAGNFRDDIFFFRGDFGPEQVTSEWATMHTARWVAEHGIDRMKEVLGSNFETTPLAARAYVLAGFANRTLGENVCVAVIDGSAAQSHTVHFERAEQQFAEALRLAQALNNTPLINAALGGRASVRAWQGRWGEAVADAALVPDDFRYDAIFSNNSTSELNRVAEQTINRREYTVHGTRWAEIFDAPRVPWDTVKVASGAVQTGQDGQTPFFRQRKYTEVGDDVALTKGVELLLLRAEAALRENDIPAATSLINQQRAIHGLTAVPTPEDADAAWELLKYERGATLWLEARRFWDLRRWMADGRSTFLQGRQDCIMPSIDELNSNKNLGSA